MGQWINIKKIYTEKVIQDALNAMIEENLSLRDAERVFGV